MEFLLSPRRASIKPWNIHGIFRNIPEHPGTSNNYHNYEKNIFKKISKVKLISAWKKTKQNKKREKEKWKWLQWVKARNLENWPSPFSQVRLQFNHVTVFPYHFVVHRKPRWWCSSSLIKPKTMGTRVWFLYSIHCINSKTCAGCLLS